jgi:hypothetical protein
MDSKVFWIGIVAIGALFLLPEKKKKRRMAMSGLSYYGDQGQVDVDHAKRLIANGLQRDLDKKTISYIQKLFVKLRDEESKAYDNGVDTLHHKWSDSGFITSSLTFATDQVAKILQQKKESFNKYEKIVPEERGQMTLFGGFGIIDLNVKKRCIADVTRTKIRCRVQEPEDFEQFFTRTSTTPGIKYVMGQMKGKQAITQSVLFDKDIWNQSQAKHWFNKNINWLLERDKKALNLQG